MAEQVQKGYSDTSDDEVNEILQGFVLTPKIDGEINSNVSAGHSWFNCTFIFVHVVCRNSYMCTARNSYMYINLHNVDKLSYMWYM